MDNKKLENKAVGSKQKKVNLTKQQKESEVRRKNAEEVKKKEAKLKTERQKKVREEALKAKKLYVTTDKYPCLEEGIEKVISNELIVKKFIKKGYIKHVKK